MAAIETVTKLGCSLKLNNGTTSTGKLKTVSVALPKLNKAVVSVQTTNTKIMAIVNLLSPVLAKNVEQVVKTVTSDLEDD